MADGSLDELFKNTLQDHPSPVPDDMWERISRKKNRRRAFLFFWLPLLGLLGSSAIAYVVLTGNKESAGFTAKKVTHIQQKNYDSSKAARANVLSAVVDEATRIAPVGTNPVNLSELSGHRGFASTGGSTHRATSILVSVNSRTASKIANPDKASEANPEVSAAGSDSNTAVANNEKNLPDTAATSKKTNGVSKTDSAARSESKAKPTDAARERPSWWIDLYVSPDYPFISDAPFLGINQSQISYTIGIAVNRSLGSHFSIKAGIQYSQINFNDRDSNLVMSTYHLKTLDVPVVVGYLFGKGKLKYTIEAGGVANIYTYRNSLDSFFKPNTGVSLYGGLNITLPVNERISVFAEPYYRYHLSSMTISSVPFDKFIDVAGISLGMRYYFFKPAKK